MQREAMLLKKLEKKAQLDFSKWLYLLESLFLLGLGCPPVLQVQVILLLLLVFPGVLHCHALKLLQINLQCIDPQL